MFRQNMFRDNLDTIVESFIEDMFSAPADTFKKMTSPTMRTDIVEAEDHYDLTIDLPGYEKENLKVELKEGTLTVTANETKAKEEQDQAGKYIRRERYTGSCKRSFYVGEQVKQESIRASFEKGVLKLTIQKEEPQAEKDFSINID